jgi:perosamine synthetase
MIHINQPQIGKEEINAAVKVLKSRILTHGIGAGPNVTRFENAYSEFARAKYAVAMNSGTAALHSSLIAAGVKPKDEVILPSFTFVATAEVVVMVGAKPVFADINPLTYTISPKAVGKAVTNKTKVIMPVDLYGMPADTQAIKEIADEHELRIIEDAAQAHGATCMNKPVGAFSDVTTWSFYGSKNMTTGEGGMLTTNDKEIADTTRIIRSHGEKEKYQSLMLGHNYHMPEIEAAIGIEQLKKLPQFVAKRRTNAKRLTQKLAKNKSLELPVEPKSFKCSWYLYTVRLRNASAKKRNALVGKLQEKGIGAFVCYVNPIHTMPYYRRFGQYRLPETERVAKQVFSLPVHPGVTPKEIDFIAQTVTELVK